MRTRYFAPDVPLRGDFNGTVLHPLCRFRTSVPTGGSSAGGSAIQFPADSAEKVSEKDEESNYIKPVCFDCGGTEFLEGPSDGVITNIKCADKDCGSEYRYTGFGPMERLIRTKS